MSLGDPHRYIVIAQEDERQRDKMRNALTPEYEVKCIGDGFAALSEVINRKPDALIVDLVLPGMSGLEVVRSLAQPSARHGSRLRPAIYRAAHAGEKL